MFFNHWKCKIYTNVQILQNRFLGQIELTGYILPTTVLRRQTFLEKWAEIANEDYVRKKGEPTMPHEKTEGIL